MARQKKIKSLQVQENKGEVRMSEQEATNALEDLEKEIDAKRAELESVKVELAQKKAETALESSREGKEVGKIIVDNQSTSCSEKAALKEKIAKQKAYDNVMVTGKFINRRVPGKTEKLPYMKYEDDPVKWHTFVDGRVYTIPRGFADQINGGTPEDPCYYMPRFVQKTGEYVPSDAPGDNSQIAEVDTSNKKYSFVPVNF